LGVVLFDWGGAGWGLPAADLGLLGLPHHGRLSNHRDYMTYLQIIQGQWPSLNVQKIQRLEKLGQMFWALKIISLEVNKFDYPWAETEHTLNNFRIYGSVLADSMRSGGWST
jgi:thiamine kinase-like enzyme